MSGPVDRLVRRTFAEVEADAFAYAADLTGALNAYRLALSVALEQLHTARRHEAVQARRIGALNAEVRALRQQLARAA